MAFFPEISVRWQEGVLHLLMQSCWGKQCCVGLLNQKGKAGSYWGRGYSVRCWLFLCSSLGRGDYTCNAEITTRSITAVQFCQAFEDWEGFFYIFFLKKASNSSTSIVPSLLVPFLPNKITASPLMQTSGNQDLLQLWHCHLQGNSSGSLVLKPPLRTFLFRRAANWLTSTWRYKFLFGLVLWLVWLITTGAGLITLKSANGLVEMFARKMGSKCRSWCSGCEQSCKAKVSDVQGYQVRLWRKASPCPFSPLCTVQNPSSSTFSGTDVQTYDNIHI